MVPDLVFDDDDPSLEAGEGCQEVPRGGAAIDPGPRRVPEGDGVATLRLSPPWPNPMRGEAILQMAAPSGSEVAVTICDVSGRVVRALRAEPGADGTCSVVWDGTDSVGGRVASGVYFVSMSPAGRNLRKKIVLAR